MKRIALAMMLVAAAAPAAAQTATAAAAPTASTPVDPTRLAAARDLIDTIMPPATRGQMIDTMVRPMIDNLQHVIVQDPTFAKAFADDPRARDLFERFLRRQTDRSLATMQTALPGMWEAMARAYARRFDIAQMRDMKAFFQTPTGRVYLQQATTIMRDPDIAAWQADMMRRSMGDVQNDVAQLSEQMAELSKDAKK